MKRVGCGVVVSTLLVVIAACGDGGSGSGGSAGGGTPCQQLSNRMCQKARECAAGSNACEWRSNDGNSTGRNCSVCEGGILDRLCNDPTKTPAQIDTCAAAFDRSTCEAGGVALPEACNGVLTCGGGPCKN